jgi:hypothetical protein
VPAQSANAKPDRGAWSFDPARLVLTERSNLLTMNDRHQLEQEFMQQLEGEGEAFEARKKELIGLDGGKRDIK